METKDVLYELRTKHELTQDELAEKVFVTRQAVSRWEKGETVPNPETLKLLSKVFNVSINTLLGSPHPLICQCCGMPLEDAIISHNSDGTLNEDYCKWCYADGTYTYSDMDNLIDVCVQHMVGEEFTEEQARAYMKALLPTLDYWKRYDELSDHGEFDAFKRQLIDEINARGEYPLRLVNNSGYTEETIKNVSSVNGNDIEETSEAIAECDIMATAVGARVLGLIVPNIVAGLRKRWARSERPLNIIICENLNVVGMDNVELNPGLDPTGRSTALACKFLRECLLALAR